jgi:tetratricopeptide (TPR) repeat protein
VQEHVGAVADVTLAGRYHFAVALVSSHAGSPDDAVASAEAAIRAAERCGDERTAGRARYVLCREEFWRSHLLESVDHGRRAAELLGRTGDRWWEAHCHCFLSLALCHAGEFEEALASTRRGQAIGEAMGDMRLQSYAAWNIGLIEATRLETARSIPECRRSLEISPDPLNSAFASGSLGLALYEHGEPETALAWLERSSGALYAFGVRRTAAWMHGYLAEACLRAGHIARSEEQGCEALATAREVGHPWAIGVALRTLGRAALAGGHVEAAHGRLTEARETFESYGGGFDVAVTRMDLARCAQLRGSPADAHAELEAARAALSGIPAPRWLERLERLARDLGMDTTAPGSIAAVP